VWVWLDDSTSETDRSSDGKEHAFSIIANTHFLEHALAFISAIPTSTEHGLPQYEHTQH
jgi:hypothetical protein